MQPLLIGVVGRTVTDLPLEDAKEFFSLLQEVYKATYAERQKTAKRPTLSNRGSSSSDSN